MPSIPCYGSHGRSFEKWEVGATLHTKERTVAESDIVRFAEMTGYSGEALFSSVEYLKSRGHQRRLVPGKYAYRLLLDGLAR